MNIAELKAAAETLAQIPPLYVNQCNDEFAGVMSTGCGPTYRERARFVYTEGATARAMCLAANALPKLLAVVEAAQETAETGGNILGLKEALHALEGKEADNVDR